MVRFAETSSEPSHGLEFAKKQLEKHGWSKGKGLGKDESGMASTIKVGIKKDNLGVGFDVGKEFTNHWWDHMFNKAASNIVVEQSEEGIHVKKKECTDLARPKKIYRVKGQELYYGRFVKATNGDAESDEVKHDVKTKFTDEELLKACGGRTGHKSARHGHQLSGKLKRVAEQDLDVGVEKNVLLGEKANELGGVSKQKKKKKKRRIEAAEKTEKGKVKEGDAPCEKADHCLDSGIRFVAIEEPSRVCLVSDCGTVMDGDNGKNERTKKKKRKRKDISDIDDTIVEKKRKRTLTEKNSDGDRDGALTNNNITGKGKEKEKSRKKKKSKRAKL